MPVAGRVGRLASRDARIRKRAFTINSYRSALAVSRVVLREIPRWHRYHQPLLAKLTTSATMPRRQGSQWGAAMPKFVLLDPSLHGIGGHHFEYALHVLRAAEQIGFEPWLATHRKFREVAKFPSHWNILPIYQRGIYTKRRFLADGDPPPTDAPGHGWLVRMLAGWWNDRRRAKRSTMFSPRHCGLIAPAHIVAGRSGVSSDGVGIGTARPGPAFGPRLARPRR